MFKPIRSFTSRQRTPQADLKLGTVLAFLLGAMSLWHPVFPPVTVVQLCFMMGLQNAVITKISQARIRTTHVTGLVTNLGIELGKLLYVNRHPEMQPARADRERLRVQAQLVVSFLSGGVAGALGFKHLGDIGTVPLAITLLLLVMHPALDDWQHLRSA